MTTDELDELQQAVDKAMDKLNDAMRNLICKQVTDDLLKTAQVSTASTTVSSAPTLDSLLETLRQANSTRTNRDFFLSKMAMAKLQHEFPPLAPLACEAFYGMKVHEKPLQICECWMISDPAVAKDYLNGKIGEEHLVGLAIKIGQGGEA